MLHVDRLVVRSLAGSRSDARLRTQVLVLDCRIGLRPAIGSSSRELIAEIFASRRIQIERRDCFCAAACERSAARTGPNARFKSISHELRTPLTVVVGLATELQENLDIFEHSDLQEFIGMIAGESTALSHIIEDLLVAARADIGTLAISPERVDVTEAIVEMTKAGPASHEPSPVAVASTREFVWADTVRFRQVIRSLITNARRYGGDYIAVDVERHTGVVTITVVDDGPGVPDNREQAIFQAYAQTLSRVVKGSWSAGSTEGQAGWRGMGDLDGVGRRDRSGAASWRRRNVGVPWIAGSGQGASSQREAARRRSLEH